MMLNAHADSKQVTASRSANESPQIKQLICNLHTTYATFVGTYTYKLQATVHGFPDLLETSVFADTLK